MKFCAGMLVSISVSVILMGPIGAVSPAAASSPQPDGNPAGTRPHEAILFDRYLERLRTSDSLLFCAVEPYPGEPADAPDTVGVRIDGAAIFSSRTVASRGPADSMAAWLSRDAEVPAQPRLIGAIPRLEFVIATRDTMEPARVWVLNGSLLVLRGLETLEVRSPEAARRIHGLALGIFPDYEEIKRAIRASRRRR